MTSRIEKSIEVFLKALETNTIASGHCASCAVGNLVAAAMGGTIMLDRSNDGFYDYYCDKPNQGWFHHIQDIQDDPNANLWIDKVSYSTKELYAIERIFEDNTMFGHSEYEKLEPNKINADLVSGLEHVIEYMLELDSIEADVKEIFTSKVKGYA